MSEFFIFTFSPDYLPAFDKLFLPVPWRTYLPSIIDYDMVCATVLLPFLPAMDFSPRQHCWLSMSGKPPAYSLLHDYGEAILQFHLLSVWYEQ